MKQHTQSFIWGGDGMGSRARALAEAEAFRRQLEANDEADRFSIKVQSNPSAKSFDVYWKTWK